MRALAATLMAIEGAPPRLPCHARSRSVDVRSAPGQRRSRLLAWTFSIASHLMVFAALFWPHAGPPPSAETPPILVTLSEVPKPEPPGPPAPDPGPPGPPDATPVKSNCPHGRPVHIRFARGSIERLFRR